MAGARRPSIDYRLMSWQVKMGAMVPEEEDLKELWSAYEDIKKKVHTFIHDSVDKKKLDIRETVLVGSMAEQTNANLPEFDLLLPVALDGVNISEPKMGSVIIPLVTPKLGPYQSEFVTNDVINADNFREYLMKIVEEAINYYKSIPGNFPKHTVSVKRGPGNRITVRLLDKRINEQTVGVVFIPIIEAKTDDRITYFLEPDTGSQWRLSFKTKERDFIGSWERDKSAPGCRKSALRCIKALIASRYPELPSYLGKTVLLDEIRRTKNSDTVWNSENLGNQVISLHARLAEALTKRELISFHSQLQGGSVNLIDFVNPILLEKVTKVIVDDASRPDGLVNLIKPAIRRKSVQM